jgi:hypothetical protein
MEYVIPAIPFKEFPSCELSGSGAIYYFEGNGAVRQCRFALSGCVGSVGICLLSWGCGGSVGDVVAQLGMWWLCWDLLAQLRMG